MPGQGITKLNVKTMSAILEAGVARDTITPPLGTLLMGYPDPEGKRKANSIRDPLNATALVAHWGDLSVAIVSIDVTIIEDEHVEQIRKDAESRTGIPASHVTVCSIQTHSGPRTRRRR